MNKNGEISLRVLASVDTPRMQEAMNWFNKDFSTKYFAEFEKKYPQNIIGESCIGRIRGTFEMQGVPVNR